MNVLRARRLGVQVGRLLRSKLGAPTKRYHAQRVDDYARIWRAAAESRGATWTELARDLWRVERDGVSVRIRSGEIQLDDPVILNMAGRKPLMHRLLGEAGIDVPDHAVFGLDEIGPALRLLERHPAGLVVKPANHTAAGDGVSTHITTRRQLRRAAVVASLYDSELLVERLVPGESYRLLVVGGRLRHAVGRRGPRVRGDGRSTLQALVGAENARRQGSGAPAIRPDADFAFTLGWQGRSPTDVLPDGAEVLLRAVEGAEGPGREVRTVYNSVVTDRLGPSLRETAERAAEVLGSDFVGVDVITTDLSRPLSETGGCVNEVNTTPALHHHYDPHPEHEGPLDLAAEVLDLALLRQAARHRHGPSAARSPQPTS